MPSLSSVHALAIVIRQTSVAAVSTERATTAVHAGVIREYRCIHYNTYGTRAGTRNSLSRVSLDDPISGRMYSVRMNAKWEVPHADVRFAMIAELVCIGVWSK